MQVGFIESKQLDCIEWEGHKNKLNVLFVNMQVATMGISVVLYL